MEAIEKQIELQKFIIKFQILILERETLINTDEVRGIRRELIHAKADFLEFLKEYEEDEI